jgi:hypothetical protein
MAGVSRWADTGLAAGTVPSPGAPLPDKEFADDGLEVGLNRSSHDYMDWNPILCPAKLQPPNGSFLCWLLIAKGLCEHAPRIEKCTGTDCEYVTKCLCESH